MSKMLFAALISSHVYVPIEWFYNNLLYFSEMMDLKTQIVENSGEDPTPHAAKKINQL